MYDTDDLVRVHRWAAVYIVVVHASGHVEKFTDLMVKDTVTGQSLRADKLLEDIIDALLAANPAMPTVNIRQNRPTTSPSKNAFVVKFLDHDQSQQKCSRC